MSRGELIEIGDGFRITEVLARSGAGSSRSERRTGRAPRTTRGRSGLKRRCCCAFTSRTSGSWFRRRPRLAGGRGGPAARSSGRRGRRIERDGRGRRRAVRAGDLDAGADLVKRFSDKLLGGPEAGVVVGRAGSSSGYGGIRFSGPCGPTSSRWPRWRTLGLCLEPARAGRSRCCACWSRLSRRSKARAEQLASLVD